MTTETRAHDTTTGGARIRARDWGYCHPGRQDPSVEGFTVDISPGERVLLAGPSGAGKSTVLYGLAGLLDDDDGATSGELIIDGRAPGEPGRAGVVQQDPDAQLVMASVGDDVAFAAENLGLPRDETWQRVEDALLEVGLPESLHRDVATLSGGEKQRIGLAGMLVMRPGLLLLDEVTAQLDPGGVRRIRDAVISAADRTGATLVIVEHRIEPWVEAADTLAVLDTAGAVVFHGPARSVHPFLGDPAVREDLARRDLWVPGIDPLTALPSWGPPSSHAADDVEAAAGADVSGARREAPDAEVLNTPDDTLLEARELSVSHSASPALTGVSLRIRTRDAISLVGPNGAGKSTLLLTLAGLIPAHGGSLAVGPALPPNGLENMPEDPWQWRSADLASRIGTVFQDPEHQFIHSSVWDELCAGARLATMRSSTRPSAGPSESAEEEADIDERVASTLDMLGLSALSARNPYSLSGGEKRRLSLGIALIAQPKLLFLDEPSIGQDASTFRAMIQVLRDYLDSGGTIVTSTHDDQLTRGLDGEAFDVSAHRAEPPADPGTQGSGDGQQGYAHATASTRRRTPTPSGPTQPGPALPATNAPSWLGRRNPLSKVAAATIVTIALISTMDWVSAAVVVVACCALLPAAGIGIRRFLRWVWPFAVGAVLMAWSTAVAGEDSGQVLLNLGYAQVSEGSLALGAALGARAFAIVLPCILLMRTTSPTGLADSLAQDLRLSGRFVLGALAGMNVMGQLSGHWHVLGRALRARGRLSDRGVVARMRLFGHRCFGILVMAIRKASRIAVSMQARGLGSGPRSWARPSIWTPADAVVIGGGLLLAIAALGAATVAGTFTLAW